MNRLLLVVVVSGAILLAAAACGGGEPTIVIVREQAESEQQAAAEQPQQADRAAATKQVDAQTIEETTDEAATAEEPAASTAAGENASTDADEPPQQAAEEADPTAEAAAAQVDGDDAAEGADPRESNNIQNDEEQPFEPVHVGSNNFADGVWWETVRNDLDDTFTRSIVWRSADTGSYNYPTMILDYGCYEDDKLIFLGQYDLPYYNADRNINVRLRVDDDEPISDVWRLGYTNTWVWKRIPELLEFRLKGAERLVAQIEVVNQHGVLERITATFDLSGFFETPVQGNIDHCGEY